MCPVTLTAPEPFYSYDDVPYFSRPKPETRPDHLAMLATLHGLHPASPARCRVLELGCGDGGNLIPMAFASPQSQFVGIDLGARQIADGKQRIASLDLQNIELVHADIRALGSEHGYFDYVIAHGVFSWVAREVQDHLLSLCASLLSPDGIAYISYNVYPGWHMRGLVRQLMLYHTGRTGGSLAERAAEARRFLDQTARSAEALNSKHFPGSDYEAYRRFLQNENQIIAGHDDWYLAHEFLEETNQPMHFHEFAARVEAQGLQYLCEARYAEMSYSHYPESVIASLQAVENNVVVREQYLDFLRLRTFRQSLLCHAAQSVERPPLPSRLLELRVSCDTIPLNDTPDLQSKKAERYRGPSGTTVTVTNPIGKAAMAHLAAIYPQSVSIEELLDISREAVSPDALALQSRQERDQSRTFLCDMFLKSFSIGLVELAVSPPLFAAQAGEKPRASRLALRQAQAGRKVVNLKHEEVDLDDDVTYRLLLLLDGTRDRLELLHALAMLVEDGTLVLTHKGKPVENDDEFMEALEEALARHLDRLVSAALLVD